MAFVVHVDTDIGGDPDDLCALAMLLGWPGVELAGVTTSTDEGGTRAGMASYALGLAGRGDVPVAAGATGSVGGFGVRPGFPDLLAGGAEAGARIVCIGPWTNLALLEAVAARVVWEQCAPVLVPLTAGLEARLRGAHLARLRGGGRLARQGELHGAEEGMWRMGREHPELPDDLLNFRFDPLACAVAAGWDGARVEELELVARQDDGSLTFTEEPGGRRTRVVTDVDGPRFEEEWLRVVAPV